MRITSSTGTARGIECFDDNGVKLKWPLARIEFKPIEPNGMIEAVFYVHMVELDVSEIAAIVFPENE